MKQGMAHMFRDIFQLGYVVRDLQEGIDYFEKTLGTVEVKLIEKQLTTGGLVYGEDKGDWVIDLALVNVGPTNLELIAPVSGPVDIYRDYIRPDAIATFHHIGVTVEDFEKTTAVLAENDKKWAISGYAPGFGKFGYADMRQEFGHYVECLEFEQNGIDFFKDLESVSGY